MTKVDLPASPGIYQRLLPGTSQRFTLSLPDHFAEDREYPLVVMLHWGGEVPPFFGRGILEELALPALQALDAIFVAPDCRYGHWHKPESEAAVLTLINHLINNYNIDPKKIVLSGYSMGGRGVWYIAARNQTLFCAAIPMACPPLAEATAVSWQMPLFVIHSQDDEHFSYQYTASIIKELQAKGARVTFTTATDVTHFDAIGFWPYLETAVPWLQSIWHDGD